MKTFKLLIINILLLSTMTLTAKDYKASIFGVKSEGITLNTRSIQKAIDYISENGGGRLLFYVGRYQTGTLQLKSNVTIQLEEGAVLVGTTSVYDYSGVNGTKALIVADNQENIGVTGKGVIEGSGAAVLEQINVQIQKGYLKETVVQASPALIAMNNCNKITIDQFNLMNACGNVLSFVGCKNLTVNGVLVKSKAVSGSKGMVFAGCEGITMTNAYFETSAAEISSAGTSKNVILTNCKNASGKKLEATR